MRVLQILLTVGTFVASAIAQGTLAFTSTPTVAVAGVSVALTWSGGNGGPVTITLRKGNPGNLDTIGVLTTTATGGSFTWTPDPSLQTGNDYALQISQGSQVNYSSQFVLASGTASISGNSTVTSGGTGFSGGMSTSMYRNATIVYPTLTAPSSMITGGGGNNGGAANTGSSNGGNGGDGGSNGEFPTSAPEISTGGATNLLRPVMLILGAFAVVMYRVA